MSEIKGQLLGIILVLMVFGAISGAMIAIFNSLTKNIENNVASIQKTSTSEKALYNIDYKYYKD